MYAVTLAADARRFFERTDAAMQRRLDRCFDVLKRTPRRHPNIKPLKGRLTGSLWFRIGDFRVVYTVSDTSQTVIVLTIANRKDVYD